MSGARDQENGDMEYASRIQELTDQRVSLTGQLREIVDAAEAESRDLTAEETEKYGRIEGELDAVEARRARLVEQEERDRSLAEAEIRGSRERGRESGDGEGAEEEYRTAFDAYLRRGFNGMAAEQRTALMERRDLSVGTDNAGGFTVPTGFRRELYEILEDEVAMRAVGAEVITTESGEDIPMPKVSAHGADAPIVAEAAALAAADDTFAEVVLKAYNFGRLQKVSIQLLQDNAVNLERYIARELARKIAYGQNGKFATGSGTNEPEGIMTSATVGVTAASPTAITADEVIDLFYSVKRPYRRGARWVMNDATIKLVRKLKDADNQYLWQPGLVGDEPDRLLGKPVFSDEDIATAAVSAKTIAFGDFNRALVIRDVRDVVIRRLDERYAENLQVGFIAWQRSDSRVRDANAVKTLQQAAA